MADRVLRPAAQSTLWLGDGSERRIQSSPRLTPFVKWPGGKSAELAAIAVAAPTFRGRFIDPFVGGAAVLLAVPTAVPAWANDACADLVSLYVASATCDVDVRTTMEAVATAWDGLSAMDLLYRELAAAFQAGESESVGSVLSPHAASLDAIVSSAGPGLSGPFVTRVKRDIPAKFRRMRVVQASVGRPLSAPDLLANVEGAVRAGFYMAIRHRYNDARVTGRWDAYRNADFLFLREFAYAAMFRYNARDEFNVPYGGITYNRKSLAHKVRAMFSEDMVARLVATEWHSVDFEPFLLEASPTREDLVFVDPPYDSEFSDYDDLHFGWREQHRLKHVLESLPSRVLVVIKDTPMIRQLYASDRWEIVESSKTYRWTIKSRNDRRATHLTITNY